MPEIRPLTSSEVELVVGVLGLARLYQGNGIYVVAWRDGEPLGHAYVALTDPPELQDVEVRAEQRRRGVARALTEYARDEARRRGFDRLRVEVSVENAPAQALYRPCGFVSSGERPRRVTGTVELRTGPVNVDDTFLVWEKCLGDDAR